jgi:hypothetical protein
MNPIHPLDLICCIPRDLCSAYFLLILRLLQSFILLVLLIKYLLFEPHPTCIFVLHIFILHSLLSFHPSGSIHSNSIMPRGSLANHFPSKLHELLDQAVEEGHSNVISWCPDGKSFRIHHPDAMVPVLVTYFRQTKYKSLLRQLQGYNFKRVTSGVNKGNVSHPLFLRDKIYLCEQMKRKQNKPSTSKRSSPKASILTSKGMTTGIANNETDTTVDPLPPSTQINWTNFQSTMKNALIAPNQHHVTTVLTVPHIVGDNPAGQNHRRRQHGQRAASMDALRVEIDCTFSSSKNKNGRVVSDSSSPSFKRNAPQQPFVVPNTESSPEFENGRLLKRRRSYEGTQGLRDSFHSKDLSSTYKSASFPNLLMCRSQQSQDDAILKEENLQFQKSQQFKRLEKVCFSNGPQGPGTQQFQHSHHSALGTLDLDISLTTTTKTTHEKGGDPEVSSSTVFNKFALPSQFEPTPILSPRRKPTEIPCSSNNGFTLNCDISFPSKAKNKNNETIFEDIISNLPSATIHEDDEPTAECSLASEVSDENYEEIAEAFSDDGEEVEWSSLTFDSDREKDEEQEDLMEWTKGIIYEGKTDCVLEPEKFQVEVQGLLSQPSQYGLLQPSLQQLLFLQQQQQYQAMMQQQAIPIPQRLMCAHLQQQHLQMHPPMAVLSRRMPFQHQRPIFQSRFQQLKRRASF